MGESLGRLTAIPQDRRRLPQDELDGGGGSLPLDRSDQASTRVPLKPATRAPCWPTGAGDLNDDLAPEQFDGRETAVASRGPAGIAG
jgi:hypothetical protein